jgi:hypothetical protein
MARYIPFLKFPSFQAQFVFSWPSKRAELKLQPPEEQARVAALNKEYQATYRERYVERNWLDISLTFYRHRQDLAKGAKKRRTAYVIFDCP